MNSSNSVRASFVAQPIQIGWVIISLAASCVISDYWTHWKKQYPTVMLFAPQGE